MTPGPSGIEGADVAVGAGGGVAAGGAGVAVGGTGVAVGGTGVAVGGTGVAVGGTGVAVGGTGVAVGAGGGVAVGGTGVAVGCGACVGAGVGSRESPVQARRADRANTTTMQISLDMKSEPTFQGRLLRIRILMGYRRVPLAVYVRGLFPSSARSGGPVCNAASHEQLRRSIRLSNIVGARLRARQPLIQRFMSKTASRPRYSYSSRPFTRIPHHDIAMYPDESTSLRLRFNSVPDAEVMGPLDVRVPFKSDLRLCRLGYKFVHLRAAGTGRFPWTKVTDLPGVLLRVHALARPK